MPNFIKSEEALKEGLSQLGITAPADSTLDNRQENVVTFSATLAIVAGKFLLLILYHQKTLSAFDKGATLKVIFGSCSCQLFAANLHCILQSTLPNPIPMGYIHKWPQSLPILVAELEAPVELSLTYFGYPNLFWTKNNCLCLLSRPNTGISCSYLCHW